ncbi:hypothetical protein [Streptomyces parvus]|uniref:hypothetical protein n=1 Tax=Streptomyces parvus TaxID=66428 RepID=UPI0033FBAB22
MLSTTTWTGAALGALLTGADAAPFSPLIIMRMPSGWTGWNSAWSGSPVSRREQVRRRGRSRPGT